MDVNKLPHSDYFMQIATWKPAVLVEIHGHKGTKEIGGNAYYHIEISSGSTSNQQSKKLAERIKEVWNDDPELKEFSISGDYDAIHFTASKSVTINGAPWLAYHIELPPALRIQEGTEKPPEVGYRFCKILENVLKEFHLRNAP